jgi:site-specific recombinase XerD
MQAKIGSRLIETLPAKPKAYDVWDTDLDGFVLRVRPSGVKTYLYSFRRPDGRRTSFAIGRYPGLTPAQARDLALEAAVKVKRGGDPILEKRRARVHTLRAFLKEKYGPWVLSHQKRGQETLNRIENCFSELLDRQLSDISQWQAEVWRRKRREDEIEAATINRDVNALRAMFSKAVEWEIIETHPLSKLKPLPVKDDGVVRYLSEDEEQKLRAELDARELRAREARARANTWRCEREYDEYTNLYELPFTDDLKPRVLLSMNTGIRRGELFQLKWTNWSRAAKLLTIPGEYTKNGKTRHIPLCREAAQVVEAWWCQSGSPSEGLMFPGRGGGQLTWIRTAWAKVLTDAKIEDFRWHDLRHHFASQLVMRGVDLNTVRELLGHADIKMTLRYAHLAPHVKAAAVATLDRPREQVLHAVVR